MILDARQIDVAELNARDLARGWCLENPGGTIKELNVVIDRYLKEHWNLTPVYEWRFVWEQDDMINYPTAVVIRERPAVQQLGDLV